MAKIKYFNFIIFILLLLLTLYGCSLSNQTQSVASPVLNPAGGTFANSADVSLSCKTTGATIYYTTDGSDPTTSNGTVYTAPITITNSTIIKAIAYKDGISSSIISADFNINRVKWKFKTDYWIYSSSPAIGNDGTIYIGSDWKYLYAIKSTSMGLANSPWPKFQKDNKNTGNVNLTD